MYPDRTADSLQASTRRPIPLWEGVDHRWWAAGLSFLPVAVLRAGTLAEPDTFWQVRVGAVIVQTASIPPVDAFSWTAFGEAWTLNSWAFDALLGAAYLSGGLPGVALVCAALTMLVAAALLGLARSLGAHPLAAAAVLFLACPLLMAWLSARPQLVDYVAVPVLVLLLRRILARRTTAFSVAGVGALFILWVNLHAAVLLGVAIVLVVAGTALLSSRGRQGGWCAAAAVVAVAGSLVNPYGWGVVDQAMRVQGASNEVIVEWQHLNLLDGSQVTMVALGLSALCVAVQRREVVLGAALAVVLVGGVVAIRVLPVVVVLAVAMLAVAASQPWMLRYARSRRRMLTQGGLVGLLVLVGLAASSLTHLGRPDPNYYPPASVVAQIPQQARLFNSYDLGGFILLQRPDVAVSIDSRNDMYGADHVMAVQRVLAGGHDPKGYLSRADAILVHPEDGIAARLPRDPAWLLVAETPTVVLYTRR